VKSYEITLPFTIFLLFSLFTFTSSYFLSFKFVLLTLLEAKDSKHQISRNEILTSVFGMKF